MDRFRYYTVVPEEGHILVWPPGDQPVMWLRHETVFYSTTAFQLYFSQPEPMVYIPWDVMMALTRGCFRSSTASGKPQPAP